jgi:hypothetical protein
MAMDMSLESLLEQIGHDGSAIVFPWLTEPKCRRGFHIQEMIHVATLRGLSVTPYEIVPAIASADATSQIKVLIDGSHEKRLATFNSIVNTNRGVITGQGLSCQHAVAFDCGRIYDPEGREYQYTQENCLHTYFVTQCAWTIR